MEFLRMLRWLCYLLSPIQLLGDTATAFQHKASLARRSVVGGSSLNFGVPNGNHCVKQTVGTCQPLQFATCFDVKLPYAMTSTELVHGNRTQADLHLELTRWEGLRSIPKCWAVIQPLLCSFYFPKCQNDSIDLLSQEFCRIVRTPCRLVEEVMKQLPEFLDCTRFPNNCNNERELRASKFNTSAKCLDPMKEVENPFNYYEGFEGCALRCQNPYFSDEEHRTISSWIWWGGIIGLTCNGWVVLTFFLEWKMARFNEYPSRAICWCNLWYVIAIVGWLFQYLPLGKEDIVCRKDGTVRRNEPTNNENIFCAMVFSWIYYSIMSALAWLLVFAYVFHLTSKATGRVQPKVEKKRIVFNVCAILFPFVLTVISLSMGKVDGSSVYGICFVGFFNPTYRIFCVMLPIGLTTAATLYFLGRGTYRIFSISLSASDRMSATRRAEVKAFAARGIFFIFLVLVVLSAAIYLQFNSITYEPLLEKSLRESFLCKIAINMTGTGIEECPMTDKPDINLIIGNIVIFFLGGVLMAYWGCTSSAVNIWKRCLTRWCGSDDNEDHRPHVKKHKLISRAYQKRDDFMAKGRLSLTVQSSHSDPVGLNRLLDPDHLTRNPEEGQQLSNATGDDQDISSDWIATIPHLINRRGAIVPNSSSVSYASEDSRRPSFDSVASEQYATLRQLHGTGSGLDLKAISFRKHRKERFKMTRRGKFFKYFKGSSNRDSSTSLESNTGSQILPAITKLIAKREQLGEDNLFVPNNQLQRFPTKAIQTSIETLHSPSKCTKACNISNDLRVDKSIQCSLVSLHEIGTQTKKSGTKKKDKRKKDKETTFSTAATATKEDPVLKLLTPN